MKNTYNPFLNKKTSNNQLCVFTNRKAMKFDKDIISEIDSALSRLNNRKNHSVQKNSLKNFAQNNNIELLSNDNDAHEVIDNSINGLESKNEFIYPKADFSIESGNIKTPSLISAAEKISSNPNSDKSKKQEKPFEYIEVSQKMVEKSIIVPKIDFEEEYAKFKSIILELPNFICNIKNYYNNLYQLYQNNVNEFNSQTEIVNKLNKRIDHQSEIINSSNEKINTLNNQNIELRDKLNILNS